MYSTKKIKRRLVSFVLHILRCVRGIEAYDLSCCDAGTLFLKFIRIPCPTRKIFYSRLLFSPSDPFIPSPPPLRQTRSHPVLPDPPKPSRPIPPKTPAGPDPFTAGKIFPHCRFLSRFHGHFAATFLSFLWEKKNHISSPLTKTHIHRYNKSHSRVVFQTSLLYSEQYQRVIKI